MLGSGTTKHEGVQVSLKATNPKGTLTTGDALLYLDEVSLHPLPISSSLFFKKGLHLGCIIYLQCSQMKIEFMDKPEIYNRFLHIMKDFKGQAIDAPGVIQLVSSLFRGYPKLIQVGPSAYFTFLGFIRGFQRVHEMMNFFKLRNTSSAEVISRIYRLYAGNRDQRFDHGTFSLFLPFSKQNP